jgi:hypothetical protein
MTGDGARGSLWHAALALAAMFDAFCTCSLRAQQTRADRRPDIETEHMYGFTIGSGIGRPGESEIELSSIGRFGRQANTYSVFSTTAEYKYPLSGALRLEVEF